MYSLITPTLCVQSVLRCHVRMKRRIERTMLISRINNFPSKSRLACPRRSFNAYIRNRILGLHSHTCARVLLGGLSLAERVRLLSCIRARPLVRALKLTHMCTCATSRVESHTFGPKAVERDAFTRRSVYVCVRVYVCTHACARSRV